MKTTKISWRIIVKASDLGGGEQATIGPEKLPATFVIESNPNRFIKPTT
jgi:hypothetical protein